MARQFKRIRIFLAVGILLVSGILILILHPLTHAATQSHSNLASQTAPSAQNNWPQFHYNALNVGYNPLEHTLSPSTVPHLTLLWRSRDAYTSVAPAVANGIVYVSVEGEALVALDAASGAQRWSFVPSIPTVAFDAPIVMNGVVTAVTNLQAFALDSHSGAMLWSFRLDTFGIHVTHVVADGILYVIADNRVYALDPQTGNRLWSFALPAVAVSPYPPAVTLAIIRPSPAAAASLRSGDVHLGLPGATLPAVRDVIFITLGDKIYALSGNTGTILWSFAPSPGPFDGQNLSTPAIANGIVYVGGANQYVYALNAITGQKVWSFAAGAGFVESSPAVANGVVYIGSGDGSLYALNAATGAKEWSFATGASLNTSAPAVANGVVYAGSTNGTVYALDATTGVALWSFSTGNSPDTAPAVANGMLYISNGIEFGRLYAFGLR
jgi:outer membrane protein assembly factor BamB